MTVSMDRTNIRPELETCICHIYCLNPYYENCGSWASGACITWKLNKDSDSQMHSRPPESESAVNTVPQVTPVQVKVGEALV